MADTVRKIKIYFDFACPYCYNEWSFMKTVRPTANLEEDYYSWEIHPDAPLEGSLISFPGWEEATVKLNELGAPVGIQPGNMRKVFNTRKALQILEEAKKQGLQLEYMDAVFNAYFEEQRNVAEDSIILEIAEKVGVKNAAAVLAEGRYLNIIAEHDKHCMDINLEFVPSIFEDGKMILSGVLSLEDIQKEFGK